MGTAAVIQMQSGIKAAQLVNSVTIFALSVQGHSILSAQPALVHILKLGLYVYVNAPTAFLVLHARLQLLQ